MNKTDSMSSVNEIKGTSSVLEVNNGKTPVRFTWRQRDSGMVRFCHLHSEFMINELSAQSTKLCL